MFQADKTLDGDTKPLQLLILFQAVGNVGVQALQLIAQQLQQLILQQLILQQLILQQLQHCLMKQQLQHCRVLLQLQQQFQVLL